MRLSDMGVTGTILAAKATSGVDVVQLLDAFDFGPPDVGEDGWFVSEAYRHVDWATDFFEDLIDALGGPAFIVKVFPDEWAYLIAFVPESEPMAVVLTPDALRAEVGPEGHFEPESEPNLPDAVPSA